MKFEDKAEIVINQLRADRDRLQNIVNNHITELEKIKTELKSLPITDTAIRLVSEVIDNRIYLQEEEKSTEKQTDFRSKRMKKLIISIDEKIYEKALKNKGTEKSLNDIDKLSLEVALEEGILLEDIVDGIKSHKWSNNEGSKEIYNNAIDNVLTYIEEKLGETK